MPFQNSVCPAIAMLDRLDCSVITMFDDSGFSVITIVCLPLSKLSFAPICARAEVVCVQVFKCD